jgi:hypothetical protein
MHRSTIKTLRPTTIAPLVASLAALGLGACGSSGGGSSNSASTPAATNTTAEATATATTPTTPTTTSTTPTATTTTPETKPVSVARRRELASEVARCLRKYGGQVAEPGPEGYLKLEGAPTKTPQFKAAVQKCHSVIVKAFAEAAGKKG